MDIVAMLQRFRLSLGKYRWACIVLLAGLCLMLLPIGTDSPEPENLSLDTEIPEFQEGLEHRLETILAQIQGAGEVSVLLTEQTGSETRYQSDTDSDGASLREETVILESKDRAQSGLIQRIDPPKYLGAVVVCQGGDDPKVRLAIVEAVSCATGLGADQISVIKMK